MSYKLTSNEAKRLLTLFKDVKIGQVIEGLLPSPIPTLSGETIARCSEREDDRFWQFDLFWYEIPFGSVVAEVHGDSLILEAL